MSGMAHVGVLLGGGMSVEGDNMLAALHDIGVGTLALRCVVCVCVGVCVCVCV